MTEDQLCDFVNFCANKSKTENTCARVWPGAARRGVLGDGVCPCSTHSSPRAVPGHTPQETSIYRASESYLTGKFDQAGLGLVLTSLKYLQGRCRCSAGPAIQTLCVRLYLSLPGLVAADLPPVSEKSPAGTRPSPSGLCGLCAPAPGWLQDLLVVSVLGDTGLEAEVRRGPSRVPGKARLGIPGPSSRWLCSLHPLPQGCTAGSCSFFPRSAPEAASPPCNPGGISLVTPLILPPL